LRGARFALAKFRPPALPVTLITRPGLHEQLAEGADQRLTVVVGSAGAGKSVLLADWAAARPPGMTSWLSCDRADTDPARFWAGFIEAPRAIDPGFGAEAADLLAMDRRMSADVTASLANDAAKLPAGPPLMARKLGGRASVGLLIQAAACVVMAVVFKLDSIASIGSAVALVIFTMITAAHVRIRADTGAKLPILILAIVAAGAVFVTFVFTTLIHEPASIITLAGILVLSVALDYGWKHFRDTRTKNVQLAH